MEKNKNVELELYRFVMAIMIATLHFSEDYAGNHGPFPGGYLGVDFYFILSGFFLMRNYESKKYGDGPFESTMLYFKRRLKKLYPPYLIATLLMLLTSWALNGGGLVNLFRQIWDIRWQLICCHFLGMPASFNMRSVWYISSLLILSWLIFFLISKYKEAFLGFAPVFGILLLAYIARDYGSLSMQGAEISIFNGGMVRGFAEMSLGSVIAHITNRNGTENVLPSKRDRYVSFLLRVICYCVIIDVMHFHGFDITDFSVIPAFLLLLFVAERYPFATFTKHSNPVILRRGGGHFQFDIVFGRD